MSPCLPLYTVERSVPLALALLKISETNTFTTSEGPSERQPRSSHENEIKAELSTLSCNLRLKGLQNTRHYLYTLCHV